MKRRRQKSDALETAAVANMLPNLGASFDFSQILAVADALPIMIGFVDRTEHYRFINRALADWFERPRREMLGRTMREMLGDKTYESRRPLIEAAFAGERQWFAADFNHPTRGLLAVQADYVPQTNADGEVIGMILLIQDITEQRMAERALKESEARFRRIADSAPVMMWVTRLDRTRDFVNDVYVEFTGLSREEARLLDWRERIHPYDQERIIAESVAGEASLKRFTLEARYLRHDGEWRWLRSVSQPRFGADGALSGFIGAGSDVTEAKEAELELQRQVAERTAELSHAQDQLRQSQKMEALGQLTGGIAHDFNNLLTVVVGGLDLIAKEVTDERLLRYANNALAAAERGARLTGQLLAFSRVQRLEVKPTYVAPLIEEMRPLLRNVLGPGIEKEFDLDPRLMPVLADPTQLEVAVLNLAINARDAMPEGGTLTISSQRRRIGDDPELEPGTYIELSIADTGAGMAPEVLARAFEPFFTTKEVGKGTGLGLSMVYGMARQSGGGVRIESEPGVGTTVRLYFRRADRDGEVPASGGKTGHELRRSRGTATVLVIDDDDDVRQFIAASLEEYGHDVIEAADGVEGIDRFGACQPDLVVIDYVMPGLSGAEVAAHIVATKPDQPILFVSGYNETDAIRKVAPDANILAKPFRAAVLEDAVRAALARTTA
ncbi:PAS domain S-box protein [Sphingomonas sp. G124]|uniref:histidine kinase n=1 Tax=Sphingomonas cremea TaxID=2904799 RepID=A0A9X1TWB9_9SPHN|nr:PAS domain-containing sensor histidine kinase [Sphingomonas cremea]MCF2515169.1 PAS domain S-box protein [Sphingomonas cremea]